MAHHLIHMYFCVYEDMEWHIHYQLLGMLINYTQIKLASFCWTICDIMWHWIHMMGVWLFICDTINYWDCDCCHHVTIRWKLHSIKKWNTEKVENHDWYLDLFLLIVWENRLTNHWNHIKPWTFFLLYYVIFLPKGCSHNAWMDGTHTLSHFWQDAKKRIRSCIT